MSESVNDEELADVRIDSSVINPLLDQLSSKDGLQRRSARQHLVDMGKPAAPYLIRVLQSPSERGRWEAAKALGEIRDPLAAPALVQALEDEESAIRWLAARGLIALGRASLRPLLEALEAHSNSVWMREGAHHVLHTLIRDGEVDAASPVLEALEDIEPSVEVPIAAYYVLKKIRQEPELELLEFVGSGQESRS
jgi:HEAT repeats